MPNHNEEDNARSSARQFAGDRSSPMFSSGSCSVTDDYDKDITQELRWLRAKYQMELRELKSRQVEGKSVNSNTGSSTESPIMHSLVSSPVAESNGSLLKPLSSSKHCSLSDMPYLDNGCLSKEALRGRLCGSTTTSFSPDHFFTAKSFYTGTSMTNSLHRTTSLPVDAVDV
ncbi:hypothetical protein Syun_029212 [Stephania yunnanensis]|uniref:Uncharacterized protein n=1 Tax=Stephania yunnanensis TaxID=152371 RepID=A0AAP0HFT8_9MAGN